MEFFTDLKRNIISWYPIKENQTVLQIGEDAQIFQELKNKTENVMVVDEKNLQDDSKKYDFIIWIGTFEKLKTEKEMIDLLKFAKKTKTENGKILLAMQNKFGMKYWAGEKVNGNAKQYETIISSSENCWSLPKIKNCLNGLKLKFKFYYPLPDYQKTNVIYTDEFMPTNDSIDARNLDVFEGDNRATFSEREAYKQLLNEEKSLFPFFSNAFFIEISEEENFEDIKYVSFGINRKKKYRLRTMVNKNYVYKTAYDKEAMTHIQKMANNIEILKRCKINCLDKVENDVIVSYYLKEAESFDAVLMRSYQTEGLEGIIEKINQYKTQILDKLLIDKLDLNQTVFEKYEIFLPQSLKEKLHFTKNGLYDLIFQNCLVQNNELFIYDQEWYEENVPIEFILYRAILYFTQLRECEKQEHLYKKLGLIEFVEYFEELDQKLQIQILDEKFWELHEKKVNGIMNVSLILDNYEERKRLTEEHIKNLENSIERQKRELESYQVNVQKYQETIELSNHHIQNLEKEMEEDRKQLIEFETGIQAYRQGVEDLTTLVHQKDAELVAYANQLRTISKSLSWKITKPIRILSWVLNPFNGASLLDRIMPPGGKRRRVYDQKQTEKKYAQKVANYFKLTDEETAEFWKGMDHRKSLKLQKDLKNQAEDRLEDYEKWVLANTPTQQELEKQQKTKFKKRPKISIVIPLYQTKTEFFRELLYSVHCQTYANWELCLADGSPEPLKEIQKMCEKDKRIQYKFLGKNEGISKNTNEAIKMATGEFIGLLDHDDMLSLDALFEVVKIINQEKNVEFIYSDEDKFQTLDESRYMPHFKPDFAPDTLRANNYICHFSVIKKSLLDKVGYFNHEFDGAQDFDLILRVTEQAQKIVHISKILYHWRVHQESTAMSAEAKPYAFIAGRKAVEAHLQRIGVKGQVKDGYTLGTYAVEYDVIGNPKVTILIPNKDGIDILEVCLKSILGKTTYPNYEIVIIENNSENTETFEYYKKLQENPKIKIITYPEKGFNYSKIINFGVKNTNGDFIIQLNNDTELLTPNWLQIMLGFAQREDVGRSWRKIILSRSDHSTCWDYGWCFNCGGTYF